MVVIIMVTLVLLLLAPLIIEVAILCGPTVLHLVLLAAA